MQAALTCCIGAFKFEDLRADADDVASLLDPTFVQPLADAAAAMCEAVVREAAGSVTNARSLASKELVRGLLPLAIRVQQLCLLGVCLLGDRLPEPGSAADADAGELHKPGSAANAQT